MSIAPITIWLTYGVYDRFYVKNGAEPSPQMAEREDGVMIPVFPLTKQLLPRKEKKVANSEFVGDDSEGRKI
jgi:hypothetical protein